VLWVVAFHYMVVREAAFSSDPWIALVRSFEPLNVVVHHGFLGVDLFFLITGFLLTLPWFRHADQGRAAPSTLDFYRRRARRILPAYYVQLAFLFLVCIPLLRTPTELRSDVPFYVVNLVAHATMLHYTTPITSASMSVNGALWTLSLEAQYYLLLPLLAPLFVRAPARAAIALCAAALAWHWASHHDLAPLVALEMKVGAAWNVPEGTIRHLLVTQLPAYLAHFAIGILAGRAWFRWRGRSPSPAAGVAWIVAAVAALAVVYRIHRPGAQWLGEQTWFLIPLMLGVAMLALVCSGVAAARLLLANRPLLFVGRCSYSAYLYHLPLLLLWNRYAPRELGAMSLPLYLALVLAVSWSSWRFVELRFMHAGSGAARAGADGERGNDGERLQERDTPEHGRIAPGVHEQAEDQRGDGKSRVDA
jgi:peptidoglycan/LPS O-acetylase OafA/YrhL